MTETRQENKIIVLDFGIFMHRAIFASVNNPNVPATYTCMSMILGCLRRIGVDPDDTVIVAVDYLKSWRKEYEDSYKADRKQRRDESVIDFKEQYNQFNQLVDQLIDATSWGFVKIEHLEADDIMAVACRFYNDQEVILVTYDSDLEQCWHYPNVKIFSPMKKSYKLKPKNFNLYKLLSKKIKKEASDNLTSPVLNEQDYENRLKCINLIELPQWVEEITRQRLNGLQEKPERLERIPFNTIRQRFGDLYSDKSKVITYEACVEKEERKKRKKEKKKKEKVKK